MRRIPVSAVVTASGSPRDFRICLDTLRPSLDRHDEVVCSVPNGRDDLRAVLDGQTWLTVLDGDAGDQGSRWAAGLAATNHPVTVLLDGDLVFSAQWLAPVAAAFEDHEVVAAGPRCFLSYGPQHVPFDAEAEESLQAFESYAGRWRQRHRNQVASVDRLGPVCVAVRREALDRAGGPSLDLPYDRLRTQGRIVLAHEALVAHANTQLCSLRAPNRPPRFAFGVRPLISASMIVKDEEDVLDDCLLALRGFADEVVVYDTGSTDRTRQIAEEHGARVVDGYWDDHFGDARNRSIAHCRGDWILIVDADELLNGDPAAIRAQVANADAPVLRAQQESGYGPGGNLGTLSVPQVRLFRRDIGRYAGRLHEQVVDRISGLPMVGPSIETLRILHYGYTTLRNAVKEKKARNLRLAKQSADADNASVMETLHLARSQMWADEFGDTIDTCRRLLSTRSIDNYVAMTALDVLVRSLMALKRIDEAEAAIEDLKRLAQRPATTKHLEAFLRHAQGDHERVVQIAASMPDRDEDDLFNVIERGRVAPVEIQSLHRLGRHHDAAQRLREYLRAGTLPLSVPDTAEVLAADGSTIGEVASLLPRPNLRALLHAAADAPDAMVDDLLEALCAQYPDEPIVLALAGRIGARLPVIRALEWSVRLRHHIGTEHCTLVALAGNRDRTPRDRALAAAVAVEMFADHAAMPLLVEALDAVPDDENAVVLQEMRLLAPGIAAAVEPVPTG